MIQEVDVTNHKGETLQMVLSNPWTCGVAVTNIDGIGGAEADINTTDMSIGDGAWFNSARARTRNIVFTLKPMRPNVEENRHTIYKYFPVKRQITMRFLTDERDLRIDGYVESVSTGIFQQMEACSISVLCVDPYFYAEKHSEESFSGVRKLFEFPFSSENVNINTDHDKWNTNLVMNWDMRAPTNTQVVGNPNILKTPIDLRYMTEPVMRYPPNTKAYAWTLEYAASIGAGAGAAVQQGNVQITTDGIAVNRVGNWQTGWSRLRAYVSKTGWTTGYYTFSFVTKEYGFGTITGNMTNGKVSRVDKTLKGTTDICAALAVDSNSALICDFYVGLNNSLTVQQAKLEAGQTQTMINDMKITSWHGPGAIFDTWTASGQLGNFNIEILSGDRGKGVQVEHYKSSTQDFSMGTQIKFTRGQKLTDSS